MRYIYIKLHYTILIILWVIHFRTTTNGQVWMYAIPVDNDFRRAVNQQVHLL